jgi:hypothetical protein
MTGDHQLWPVDCCPQCGREERYLAHKIPMGLKERE